MYSNTTQSIYQLLINLEFKTESTPEFNKYYQDYQTIRLSEFVSMEILNNFLNNRLVYDYSKLHQH